MRGNDKHPDERFHFEIWNGPSEAFRNTNPSVSYCEIHNADFDYGLAAFDFKIAAQALILRQCEDPNMSNWTSPVLHMIRQTIELYLKSLIETIRWKVGDEASTVKFVHDLELLWNQGRVWLIGNGYSITNDTRLEATDRLVENLHAVDPLGDLFRFGTSRKEAFGRNKSSDRVGYNQSQLFKEFEHACACLEHWIAVVFREIIQEEQGWEKDPFFDQNSYPKIESGS